LINIINMQKRHDDWMTIEGALARLGVARQTLYAYVSRGLLRARADLDDPRRSRYDPRGIEALLERRRRGRARREVASSTIDFGEPVLISRITRIADGALFYRGIDAVALAAHATLEETAALLWDASALPALPPSCYLAAGPSPPLARCLRHIAGLAGPAIWARGVNALIGGCASLLRDVAEAAGNARADAPLHVALAHAWGTDSRGAELIRRALVLCADHELNASTFAVRVVASTGAALPACVLAGLAALSGPLHGGMTERVAALLAEADLYPSARAALEARLARGEHLPGFGHRLYPDGDPRARALLEALDPSPWWRDLLDAARELTGLHPNVDLALVVLERVLRLPHGAALAIFATGRAAGWIAHALEQHQEGRLIRPRAVYAGQGRV
jgi:citrate synthase